MEAFEYARPASASEAVKLLAEGSNNAEVLAGGGDLLGRMKDGVSSPARLVSLGNARELRRLEFSAAQGLRIGATVTLDELASHAAVREHYPGIAQAVEDVGGPQIRNTGTVGGNLCQRPRCWYYRAGFGLLAIQNGKSLVPDGDNRYHAILGNSGPAYYVSPSSLGPALMAFDARLRVLGSKGSRELPVAKLFVTPKGEGEREFALEPDEIITEVTVPARQGRSAFYEVKERNGIDWPLVTAAVVLRMSGHAISSARVVLGQVAPVPWPSPEAERALAGKTVSAAVADAAGKAAVANATPLSHNAYKVTLAHVAVKRAVLRAAGMKA